MSGLVATAAERKNLLDGNVGIADAAKSAKIIGSGMTLANGITNGEWTDILAGGLSTAMDTVSFVLDPIASMAGSVANFLLDYMPPLPDMLDSIAGSPPEVAAQAATWYNIADRVSGTAGDLRSCVDSALTGWVGFTAEAYRTFTGFLAESIDGMSTLCQGIGGALSGASAVVEFVRSIVRDVISDLVGKLISWAAQVAATAGIGASWVVPQAIAAISLRVAKVTTWLKKLLTSVRELFSRIKKLNEILKEVVPVFKRISNRLGDFPIASTRMLPPGLRAGAPPVPTLAGGFNPAIHKLTGWSNKAENQYTSSSNQAEGDTDVP